MQVFIDVSPIVVYAFFVVVLIAVLGVFVRTKKLPSRLVRWGLFVSVALLLIRGAVFSIEQFRVWRIGFLALHSFRDAVWYTTQYALLHYFSSFFLSACIAFLLFAVFWILERRSGGRLLDADERLLVAIGALAAGWPGAILYAIGVFLLPLVATPWLARNVHERRVRLAPFIILSALLAMGITPWVLPYAPWLQVLVCKTCI